MKPDPVTYLLAIRHELRAADFFTDQLASGAAPIVAYRAAEVLAHLALQAGSHVDAAATAKPLLRALLQDIEQHALASGTGTTLTDCAKRSIETYDDNELETAVAVALRTVSAGALGNFCVRLAEIEKSIHEHYNKDVEALIARADSDWPDSRSNTPRDVEVTALLREGLPETPLVAASNVQRHSGFNSKEIFFLDINGRPGWPVKSVIRREPAYNITGAAVAEERELMEQLRRDGVPVPQVLHACPATVDSPGLIITERMAGRTLAPSNLGAHAAALSRTIAAVAARFHDVKLSGNLAELTRTGQNARARMLEAIHRFYDRWAALRSEDSAIIEAAYRWLVCNVDRVRHRVGLVHGDFNLRNILIADDRISAVLDWELSHAGDVAEDLAHIRPDLETAGTWQDFFFEYNRHVSEPISESELVYPSVYVAFWQSVLSSLALAGLPLKKSSNFIFGSIAFIEHKTNCDRLAKRLALAGNQISTL